jgi:N-formylglutamate amidohydrolase
VNEALRNGHEAWSDHPEPLDRARTNWHLWVHESAFRLVHRIDAILLAPDGLDPVMTIERDFAGRKLFSVCSPAQQRVAFVFNSPHSGRFYPQAFLAGARLDPVAIRRSEDCYVDEIVHAAVSLGAPLLKAHFPRAYLDVNREPFELDPKMFSEPLPPYANTRSCRVQGGLGTVPRVVGEGQEIYRGRLALAEALERIETIYRPYHEALSRLLVDTHRRFGHVVLIDCHSMPAGVRVAENGTRPDFIIGDRFGTSCAAVLSQVAIDELRAMGYAVSHNKPYAGGFITEHYGRPARGFHALQLEISRGLYLNEQTMERKPGFEALVANVGRLLAGLCALTGFDTDAMPLAAE